MRLATVVAVVIAAVILFIAVQGWYGLCADGTSERCEGGRPSVEIVVQLVLAVVGMVGVGSAGALAKRGHMRSAIALILGSLLVYGAWVVFLDAATHGWGSGPIPL